MKVKVGNNHVHVLKIDTSKISDIFLSEIINSMT